MGVINAVKTAAVFHLANSSGLGTHTEAHAFPTVRRLTQTGNATTAGDSIAALSPSAALAPEAAIRNATHDTEATLGDQLLNLSQQQITEVSNARLQVSQILGQCKNNPELLKKLTPEVERLAISNGGDPQYTPQTIAAGIENCKTHPGAEAAPPASSSAATHRAMLSKGASTALLAAAAHILQRAFV